MPSALVPLIAFALVAFAANSILCRMALADGSIGPGSFTAVRLATGAATLGAIVAISGRARALRAALSPADAAALFGYAAAFSFAYVALDAGVGALILFAAVQATMFAGALAGGERPAPARWAGAAAALAGLATMVAPGSSAPPPLPGALMAAAGACWGVYSLRGRRGGDALARTTAAFLVAAPAGLALWAAAGAAEPASARGLALAAASGSIASGLGYAVWYAALPRLDASLAGVAQLAAPLIAVIGGVILLGEPLTPRLLAGAALIVGGVGAATLAGRRLSRAR